LFRPSSCPEKIFDIYCALGSLERHFNHATIRTLGKEIRLIMYIKE
jgi:hypothetical protein